VALAFALFGGLVSLLLATASHRLPRSEARLIDESLTAELEDYSGAAQATPVAAPGYRHRARLCLVQK
jgi:hypothetical protein